MNHFDVVNRAAMRSILNVFRCLDEVRWKEAANYNLINYCDDGLGPDERILTHWLCYIIDRRMPFERVWDVGGYVISHLVRSYTREDSQVLDILERYISRAEATDSGGLQMQCPLEGPNRRLARYGITEGPVRFASRYMPEDLVLIYRTLAMLDRLGGRSLARLLAEATSGLAEYRAAIKRMAIVLNGLAYVAGGALAARAFDDRIGRMVESVEHDTDDYLHARDQCLQRWTPSSWTSGKKRLWCSLRDFLKSPEFNEALVAALRDIGAPDSDRWHRTNGSLQDALDVLELPGDVWNNSPVFRRGLFSPFISGERRTWHMPYTVRRIWQILHEEPDFRFYPEQLDVTFDFVPRMCERQMCGACLFGKGISKVCHKQQGLLCSVVLLACGYSHTCEPATCEFKSDSARGLCRSSTYAQA